MIDKDQKLNARAANVIRATFGILALITLPFGDTAVRFCLWLKRGIERKLP